MKTIKFCFSVILLFFVLTPCFAQLTKTYGFTYVKSDNYNWGNGYFVVSSVLPGSPADLCGLQTKDIIKTINGNDVASSEKVDGLLNYTNDVIEIKRLGRSEPLTIILKAAMDFPVTARTEVDVLKHIMLEVGVTPKIEKSWLKGSRKYHTYNDHDIDFARYDTYDFEYINSENPLTEKKYAQIVGRALSAEGLRRDTQSPDFLVIIDFFTGDETQYVPPTQSISTSYSYSRRYGKEQYIESREHGNYTTSTCTSLFKITFLDAAKYRSGQKGAEFWQGECEDIISNEYAKKNGFSIKEFDAEEFITECSAEMIEFAYPFKAKEPRYYFFNYRFVDETGDANIIYTFDSYVYTGICYNDTTINLVDFVIPGSPADKAGIKAGDILMYTVYTKAKAKFPANWSQAKLVVRPKLASMNGEHPYQNGFQYLYVFTDEKEAPAFKTFQVKRNGKKLNITVQPVRVPFLY